MCYRLHLATPLTLSEVRSMLPDGVTAHAATFAEQRLLRDHLETTQTVVELRRGACGCDFVVQRDPADRTDETHLRDRAIRARIPRRRIAAMLEAHRLPGARVRPLAHWQRALAGFVAEHARNAGPTPRLRRGAAGGDHAAGRDHRAARARRAERMARGRAAHARRARVRLPMAHAAYEEGWFAGSAGTRLFRREWRPPEASAVVVNLHGLGDHSGLYAPLAEALAAEALAVHAPDLRGHGRSPGQRAYVDRWDRHLDDLEAFLRFVAAREPGLPVFVLGHSLGGLIALDYAVGRRGGPAGIIAAAAPLGGAGGPPLLLWPGRTAPRVWPRFSLSASMDLNGLSRDPAVVEAITGDALFHRRGTARLAADVPAAIERVHARAASIGVPLLLLHGTADRMVAPEGSRAFFARIAGRPAGADGAGAGAGAPWNEHGPAGPGEYVATGRDVTLRLYDGAYHALFFDLAGDEVRRDLVRWIRVRSPQPA